MIRYRVIVRADLYAATGHRRLRRVVTAFLFILVFSTMLLR